MVKKTNLTLIMTVILSCLGLSVGYAEEGTVITEYRYGGLELRESYVILTAQKAFFGNLYTSRVPPSLTEINAYTNGRNRLFRSLSEAKRINNLLFYGMMKCVIYSRTVVSRRTRVLKALYM